MKRTYVNRLPKGEDVENTNVRIGNGELIVEVEFKEKFKPKDGDFVITPYGNIYIYNSSYAISGRSYKLHGFYAGVNGFGSIIINTDFENGFNGAERLATPEEKDAFLERLEKECHKRWNPKKKCLEDIYVPKFGDIVRLELRDDDLRVSKVIIAVYPNKKLSESPSNFFDIANLGCCNELINCIGPHFKSIRLASESEKQKLFNKLAESGKRWNPEIKQIEDIRWIPNNLEKYWYITEDIEVAFAKYDNMNNLHIFRIRANNCFKTEDAAQKVADQIKEIFKNSKAE